MFKLKLLFLLFSGWSGTRKHMYCLLEQSMVVCGCGKCPVEIARLFRAMDADQLVEYS